MSGLKISEPAVRAKGDRETRVVGHNVTKVDAFKLARGEPAFTDDFTRSGMLFAKVLRSAHAHAKVLSIDTSKARAVEGVVGVYTHKDVGGTNRHGLIRRDHPALVEDRVRYCGDAVAIVVAESERVAEFAREGIAARQERAVDDDPRRHAEADVDVHEIRDRSFRREPCLGQGAGFAPVGHCCLEIQTGRDHVPEGNVLPAEVHRTVDESLVHVDEPRSAQTKYSGYAPVFHRRSNPSVYRIKGVHCCFR